jgi:lysophospholipase L1-like esterase
MELRAFLVTARALRVGPVGVEEGLVRRFEAGDPIRRFLSALTIAVLASGCAVSPGPAASAGQATSPTQTAMASPAAELRLVAIGDSIAAGGRCECRPYPGVYGTLAAEALGQPVRVRNLAVNGATSGDLLHALRQSDPMQSAIRGADLITLTIGINDISGCGAESDGACYETAIAGLATNLEAVFTEIDALQGAHLHLLRATAYYNFVIGKPEAEQLGPSFQAFYAEQLTALNATICGAVDAHGGLCVELLTAFNGPAGDQDAAPLLVSDHAHPSSMGHETIAQQIAAAGYAPLRP